MKPARATFFVAFTLCSSVGFAQTDVDWKYYGSASVDGLSMCFFDASGVIREPGNQIRVWTKCLPQEAINDLIKNVDDGAKIVRDADQKVARGYVPPFVAAGVMNFDEAFVVAEEVADVDHVKPQTRILYELNCPERMIHELSVHTEVKGRVGSSNKATDWYYVAPETTGAWLLKILCPK
jgi:hypothetical protein